MKTPATSFEIGCVAIGWGDRDGKKVFFFNVFAMNEPEPIVERATNEVNSKELFRHKDDTL